MNITIELAKISDVADLVNLVKKTPEDVGIPEAEINYVKLVDVFSYWINTEGVYVAKTQDEGKIVGAIALTVGGVWWGDYKFLEALLIIVHPDYRKYRVYDDLIKRAKELSDTHEVDILFNFFTKPDRKETKEKLFNRKGFDTFGYVFKRKAKKD